VQRHLGSDSLHRWLDEQLGGDGYQVSRLASAKGYRVLQVTAPT
jgi:16S rRNA (guanine1207-N2)-methyltransferase